MKCHNCGSEIPEQSLFCGMCGAKVAQDVSSAVTNADAPASEAGETPEWTNMSIEPDTPVEPITEPDFPNEPGIPHAPGIPNEPGIPDEPDIPNEPDIPDAPDIPVTEPEPRIDEPASIPVTEPEFAPDIPDVPDVADGSAATNEQHNSAFGGGVEATAYESTSYSESDPGQAWEHGSGTEYVPPSGTWDQGAAKNTVIRHCQRCGAVLMEGAKFCSNCGGGVTAYEPPRREKSVGKLIASIVAVIALLAIISGITVTLEGHDIEGEWVVENNDDMFGGMFGESYLDFDDGTALYYNGLFSAQRYTYSYNRFTKILTLQGKGTDEYTSVHVEWHGSNTVVLPELDMTITRIDDIPYEYSDEEYDSDDVIQF